jgi:hypothetical protein
MAEPENHTLHLLRDIRNALKALDEKVDAGFAKVDREFDSMRSRMANIREAAIGESVLGRYAAAEVEDRLEAIEKRLTAIEKAI